MNQVKIRLSAEGYVEEVTGDGLRIKKRRPTLADTGI